MSHSLSTTEDYADLLDSFDTFLLDCDGVIWAGPSLIPRVKDVLHLLRSRRKSRGDEGSGRMLTRGCRQEHPLCNQQRE